MSILLYYSICDSALHYADPYTGRARTDGRVKLSQTDSLRVKLSQTDSLQLKHNAIT